jgi:hypothetical protein
MEMKTLRICLSSELPGLSDRYSNYIYLAYDKLLLYYGQDLVTYNFAIVNAIPDEQVDGMLYIVNSDGSVHRKVDYSDTTIAEIEDSSQIELLKKAGTLFYVNSDHRYIDSQQRYLTLPWNDGKYELNVSARNDEVYDNNTILKFNEATERFELYSGSGDDFIDYSKEFSGTSTSSIDLQVNGSKIRADAKVSNKEGNLLKIASDGLYTNPNNVVSKDEFNKWASDVVDFKRYAQDILDRVDSELVELQNIISPEAINDNILNQLSDKYTDIEAGLAAYDTILNSLTDIEDEVMDYASSSITSARDTIDNTIKENSGWDTLDDSTSSYTNEVNYYNKAEEYYYPDMNRSKRTAVIISAINQYLKDVGISDGAKSIIAVAINKYINDKANDNKAIIATAINKFIEDKED